MIENAKWIWADCEYKDNDYADFLLEFEIDKVDKDAVLEISADTEYTVYINDNFALCGQYDDYPDSKSYDTLYIADMLREGKNTLLVSGYYQGSVSMQYKKGINGICFALKNNEQLFLSDESIMAASNRSYVSGDVFKTTWQLGYGFIYDANKDDRCFKPAVVKDFNTSFVPRPIKRTGIGADQPAKIIAQGYFIRKDNDENPAVRMQKDFLSHRDFNTIFEGDQNLPGYIKLKKTEFDGEYIIIDLCEENSGFITFDLTADEGALIEIGYGEHLEDMRVRTRIGDRSFTNCYTCKEGRQSFTHYFKRIACRYLQLHISKTKKFELYYAGIKPNYYPAEQRGYFNTNDHLHNKIYEVCLNTLKQCMHEHYEDCPWREQGLYASDSRNQMVCGYYVFNDDSFAKSSISLLLKSLAADGFIDICAPSDADTKIPSFTHVMFLGIKEYTQFTNDTYFVDNKWDELERAIGIFAKNDFKPPVGDRYWNFYEWSDGYHNCTDEEKEIRNKYDDFSDGMYKAFAYLSLNSMLWLAERYGKTSFTNKYQTVACALKEEINKDFWDEEKGLYSSYYYDGGRRHYGELMQSMCIYTGIAEGKEDILCDMLVNPDSTLVKISLSYALYKYEALLLQGEKYGKIVFDDIAKRWGAMLFKGATSFWETEDGAKDFDLAGSLCHGWSAFPVYLYFRYAMGITPEMLCETEKNPDIINVFAEFNGKCKNISVVKTEGEEPEYKYSDI